MGARGGRGPVWGGGEGDPPAGGRCSEGSAGPGFSRRPRVGRGAYGRGAGNVPERPSYAAEHRGRRGGERPRSEHPDVRTRSILQRASLTAERGASREQRPEAAGTEHPSSERPNPAVPDAPRSRSARSASAAHIRPLPCSGSADAPRASLPRRSAPLPAGPAPRGGRLPPPRESALSSRRAEQLRRGAVNYLTWLEILAPACARVSTAVLGRCREAHTQ